MKFEPKKGLQTTDCRVPRLCADGFKYQVLCPHRRSVSGRSYRTFPADPAWCADVPWAGAALYRDQRNFECDSNLYWFPFYRSKKFTLYSCLCIVLTSVLTDVIPGIAITSDVLLISIFGGIINGFAISLCLLMGSTTGGTDFISIYLSEQKRNGCL